MACCPPRASGSCPPKGNRRAVPVSMSANRYCIPTRGAPCSATRITRPSGDPGRRAAFGAGLASLALALAVLGSLAPTGGAVLVPKDGSGGGSTGSAPPCATVPPATWTTPPRVLIHTTGLPAAEATADQLQGLVTQAEDAVGQLNDIGASSAHVALGRHDHEAVRLRVDDVRGRGADDPRRVRLARHDHEGQRRRRRRRSHLPDVHGRLLADGDDRVPRRPRHVMVVQLAVREGDDRSRCPLLRRRRECARRRARTQGRGSGRRSCTSCCTRSASPTRARPTR